MLKKATTETLFLIILIAIGFLFFATLIPKLIADWGKNICIKDQFQRIERLDTLASEAGLDIEKAVGFKVNWCIRCIWYDADEKALKVWVKDESEPVNWSVRNVYLSIGNSKDEARLNNPNFDYNFWVRRGVLNCTNCFDEEIEPGCK